MKINLIWHLEGEDYYFLPVTFFLPVKTHTLPIRASYHSCFQKRAVNMFPEGAHSYL